jgi:octaprenyl-diphosphate synthase
MTTVALPVAVPEAKNKNGVNNGNGHNGANGSAKGSRGAGLLSCIEGDLARVEERLVEETRSDVGAVRDISGHTLFSGGKRLRPALALLSAHLLQRDFPTDRAYAAAAASEMIHMATLMHDDVVDEAAERRGKPTANSVFGNGITVLTGDYLFAKAIQLLVYNDDNLHIVRVFTNVVVGMAEGEVLQAAVAGDLSIAPATYEDVIERKTARFLAGCCETGALMGGANDGEAAALRAYGHHLGMAFQIADDLLDFLGDPDKTGKPLGTDLRDGRVTLPLIHALQHAESHERERLQALLPCPMDGQPAPMSAEEIGEVTQIIAGLGGFEAARHVAKERAERAVGDIAHFPRNPYHDTLDKLARYVVARES